MSEIFSSEFFAGNRARLKQLFMGTAPIVVTANGLLQRGGDSPFRFAQDANFWYLTGIDEPDIILVMDKDKEYLIVPARSQTRETFDGAVDPEKLARISGISAILDEKSGWKQLAGRLKRTKHVATLAASASYIEQAGMYVNPSRRRLRKQLLEIRENLELLDLREHLARLRTVKQPEEVAAIERAIGITAKGLKFVTSKSRLPKYGVEYEIEADLTRQFAREGGGAGHSFLPIVAGGKRACSLHNVANDAPLSADELVVMDVGAEWCHYAADITRTVALGGNPSSRQQEVYAAVQDVQKFALEMLKPGLYIKEYEQEIEQFMGEKLRGLGLIKTISPGEVRKYYPHATSHFLGLNVHDVGDYRQPLAENMVLTCEPGIYITEERLGIRLEDDILITPNGHKNLSAALPQTLTP
jgi:Xaa-Pro aminopeptidase